MAERNSITQTREANWPTIVADVSDSSQGARDSQKGGDMKFCDFCDSLPWALFYQERLFATQIRPETSVTKVTKAAFCEHRNK